MSRYACAIYNQIHTTLGRTSRKEFSILFLCVIETKTTAASLFFYFIAAVVLNSLQKSFMPPSSTKSPKFL